MWSNYTTGTSLPNKNTNSTRDTNSTKDTNTVI